MTRKALIFFPFNPIPAWAGNQKRCLQSIRFLREQGYEMILASSEFSSDLKWNSESIEVLKREGVFDIRIYRTQNWDLNLMRWTKKAHRLLKKRPFLDSHSYCPKGMRDWFKLLVGEISPDLVVMNYASWHGLARGVRGSATTLIDTHDLMTKQGKMRKKLNAIFSSLLTPISEKEIPDSMLEASFFTPEDLQTEAREYQIYDQYNATAVMSKKEAELIRQNTKNTEVFHWPYQCKAVEIQNQYQGSALFAAGAHVFNLQGYFYFLKKVLPKIHDEEAAFHLQVTGTLQNSVLPSRGVSLCGFVPDLTPFYEFARFAIFPILAGTGQPIKIIEAMAHGLAVVTTPYGAEESLLEHGVHGFVAQDEKEFAEYCLKLWNDPDLRRKMGEAARKVYLHEENYAPST